MGDCRSRSYLTTGFEIFALGKYAFVIIDIVLPTVFRSLKKISIKPNRITGTIRTDSDWESERRSLQTAQIVSQASESLTHGCSGLRRGGTDDCVGNAVTYRL